MSGLSALSKRFANLLLPIHSSEKSSALMKKLVVLGTRWGNVSVAKKIDSNLSALSKHFSDLALPIHISKNSSAPKKKLVILGNGWGSVSLSEKIDLEQYDITMVSPRNYFLFTPLLCSITTGKIQPRSIIEPIRNFLKFDTFLFATATSIDLEKRQVLCQNLLKRDLRYLVDYDLLAIGVGAVNNTFQVPGVKEYAFFLKDVTDALDIRERLLSNFELSGDPNLDKEEVPKLLTIVIVGGGPTGVEFGAELYDFVQKDVAGFYKKKKELIEVILIEANEILSSFDKTLKNYANKIIRQRKHFKLLKTSVVEVTKDGVRTAEGQFIRSNLVVWSAGIAPRPVIERLVVPKSKDGRILTDGCMRVLGDPNQSAYAYGDCAQIQDKPLPPTAQVAEKQGKFLAQNILNKLDQGTELEKFDYKSFGMLAYIGDSKALSDLPSIKLQGFTSYLIWRSAYLTRLGSWSLRIPVVIDWFKTLLYGRNTSTFRE